MFCKNCGAEVKNGSKFCGKCGAPVSDTTQASGMQPTTKKKTSVISIILIAVIVITVLLGAVVIIGSIATGKASSSPDYSSSDSLNDSEEDNASFIAPSANKNVDFCYEGFSWDMSYEEAYDTLCEMNNGEVRESEDSDNNEKDMSVYLQNYDGLIGVECSIGVYYYDEKMGVIMLNLFPDDTEYSLEEVYNHMIDKCEEKFPGAEKISEDDSQVWTFYGNDNNPVGHVDVSSNVFETNTCVSVAYCYYFK